MALDRVCCGWATNSKFFGGFKFVVTQMSTRRQAPLLKCKQASAVGHSVFLEKDMMKKSLLTLAALAVVGVASAQSTVTITGKYGFAYRDQRIANALVFPAGHPAATTPSGYGLLTTDGNVMFTATEDLGGGMKAGVSLDLKLRGRAAASAVDARDATIYVLTPWGQITGGSAESPNGILPLGGAGAPVIGLDLAGPQAPTGGLTRSPLDGGVNVDFLSYTAQFGGLRVTLGLFDSIGAPGAGGFESSSASTDAVALSLAYTQGALSLAADHSSYDLNSTSPSALIGTLGTKARTRISGSYDLGVVKLGAGYQTKTMRPVVAGVVTPAGSADVGNRQWVVGISAPISSALTVGAVYSSNTQDGARDITAYDLGIQYDLSKRTGIQVAYQRAAQDTFSDALTTFRIRLMHKF